MQVLKDKEFVTNDLLQKEMDEFEETNNPILAFFKEIDENVYLYFLFNKL